MKKLNNSGCQTMCLIRLKFKTYSPSLLNHNFEVSHRLIKWLKRNNYFKIFAEYNMAARPCDMNYS